MYKIRLQRDFFLNLQQMNEVTRHICWHQNFVPWGLSAPANENLLYKIRLHGDFLKLATYEWSDKRFLLTSKFCPKGLSAPPLGLYTCIKSWKKLYKIIQSFFFKLVANDLSDKRFLLTSKFCPKGLSVPDLWLYTFIKSWKDVYKIRGWRNSF